MMVVHINKSDVITNILNGESYEETQRLGR